MEECNEEEPPHRFKASLRLFSESLWRADIARVMGPSDGGFEMGEIISKRRPDRRRRSSHWTRDSRCSETEPLADHIEELVAFAEARANGLQSLRRRVAADIFTGQFAGSYLRGGSRLSVNLMRRLVALDLEVLLEIYPPPSDDD